MNKLNKCNGSENNAFIEYDCPIDASSEITEDFLKKKDPKHKLNHLCSGSRYFITGISCAFILSINSHDLPYLS
jgi:hypothetical protein